MSESTATGASGVFARLDALLDAPERWIDRRDEGQTIAHEIANSPHSVIVLFGAPRAGKSELTRRWIVPALSGGFNVIFHDRCARPDAFADPPERMILFWDAFDACLTDDVTTAERGRELAGVIAARRGVKLVLLVRSDSMTRLAHLSTYVPELLAGLREIPPIAGARVAGALLPVLEKQGVTVRPGVFEAVTRDLDTLSAASRVGAELVAVLAFELVRAAEHGQLTPDHYEAAGGLVGVLERYLDFVFDHSPPFIDPQVAWAVLLEAVDCSAEDDFDPRATAHRFGIAESVPCDVLTWIETDRRLLRRSPRERYSLQPPQLALALDSRRRREMLLTEPVREALRQGVRQFTESEALLTPHGFKKVHSSRTSVEVTPAEAQLMLRCALAYENADTPGAIEYWWRRIPDEGAREDVLFDATFDPAEAVRRRAADHLHRCLRPEIRSQLHLLALRDASPDVRSAAVDALAGTPDPALRDSLLQEVAESTSPYRLAAIQALRIFTDAETTAALVSVVRDNAAGQDLGARRMAIEVLGGHNTPAAAHGLVDISLDDPDAEDRAAAARALSGLQTPDALDATLARARERRREAVRVRIPFSLPSLGLNLAGTLLAVCALAITVVLHGFLLLLMKRWRAAAFVFGAEAVGLAIVASQSESQVIGWMLLVLTLCTGVLMVLRTLLLERIDLVPQGRFRRCLSGVLFVVSWIPTLYLHGLDAFLIRQLRRGLILFGFELVAVLFLLVGSKFETQYGAYVGVAPETVWFSSFSYIGISVLILTYFIGVASVFWDAFLFNRRRARLIRIEALNTALLQNRNVSDAVLEALTTRAPASLKWARQMSKRFVRQMQPTLRERWQTSDGPTRRTILRILLRRPDPATLDFLRDVAPAIGWFARMRTMWAGVAYRFSVWPKPLLVAGAMVVYALAALTAGQWQMGNHTPVKLAEQVRSGPDRPARERALKDLEILGTQDDDGAVANAASLEIVELVKSATKDPQINAQLVDTVVRVAPRSNKEKELVEALADHTKTAGMQQRIVSALAAIGTPTAVQKLREFIEQGSISAARGPKEDPNRTVQEEIVAKRAALDALAAASARPEALEALMDIADTRRQSKGIPSELRERAKTKADAFDPLLRADYFFRHEDYPATVTEARKVLHDSTGAFNDVQRQEAGTLLMKAFTVLGSSAVEDQDYSTGARYVQEVLQSKPPSEGAEDFVNLALAVVFGFHEYIAPNDPAAYAQVYEMLSSVRSLAVTTATRESVMANLTESSFTTGRYDEALELARQVLKETTDPATSLNMKFFVAAALLMKGDAAAGPQALDELNRSYQVLPSGFKNPWSYAGTTSYLRKIAAPGSVKNVLLQTLTTIQAKKK